MSYRGHAYAIATAIYGGTRGETIVDIESIGDRLYSTINSLGLGSDEVKADIYAQLAERLTHSTTFERAVNVIEAAICETAFAVGGMDGA